MSPNQQKRVLITGVSKGLGKAIALRFRKAGMSIIGVSRSKPDFDVDLWIGADITKKEERLEIFEKTREFAGGIDILVNNAGKGGYETWENTGSEELKELFELNFFSAVEMTRLFLPMLRDSKGCIINISSVAGKIPVACMGHYCASKFALNAFSDSLRVELKHYGIRVLNVMPGRINTGFSESAFGGISPPETPGRAFPEAFADKVFRAFIRKRRSLIYPCWYRLIICFVKLLPRLYERQSIKIWKLPH